MSKHRKINKNKAHKKDKRSPDSDNIQYLLGVIRSLGAEANLRKIFPRIERKMTQEEFAEFVSVSVDFLSLIERGINAPSFETLEYMARRLKVPVKALFDFSATAPERR